jgi:hypothetical protein
MNIDTKVRHITKAGTNIFLDLGFTPDEAEQYRVESLRRNEKVNQDRVKDIKLQLILFHLRIGRSVQLIVDGEGHD